MREPSCQKATAEGRSGEAVIACERREQLVLGCRSRYWMSEPHSRPRSRRPSLEGRIFGETNGHSSAAAGQSPPWRPTPTAPYRCLPIDTTYFRNGVSMSLRLNDTAPNFTAETTHGKINFHEWMGDKWAILFSHPKDFTPVCTTELGYMAKIEPEFTKRNTKLIGLSVDPSEAHGRWLKDIEETQGAKVNYPIIADHDLKVAKLYNMLPAEEPGTS